MCFLGGDFMKKILLVYLLSLLCFTTFASIEPVRSDYCEIPFNNSFPDDIISKSEAIEDICFLISKISQSNPAVYKYISKSELENLRDKISDEINDKEVLKISEFFFYLSRITASIKDIHTKIWSPNWKNDKIFPFSIKIYENDIYICESVNNSRYPSIPIGAKIISINGITSEMIVETMKNYTYYTNEKSINNDLERKFNLFLYEFFNIESPFKIEYKYEGKTYSTKENEIYNPQEAFQIYREYALETNGQIIPVLELNTFNPYRLRDNELFDLADRFFAKNVDAENIVIDIRKNTGGNSIIGYYFLDYLMNDYKIYDQMAYKISQYSREEMNYILDINYYNRGIPEFMWDWPIYTLLNGYLKLCGEVVFGKIGDSILLDEEYRTKLFPDKNQFYGNVYLLIGDNTTSAAVDFASAFKEKGRGIIIGRETGNSDSYAGNLISRTLPNSGLVFSTSISYMISPRGIDDGRGVIPDIEVEYTLEDYLNKKDKDIEKLLEMF